MNTTTNKSLLAIMLSLTIIVAGCGTIRSYRIIEQPTGQSLSTGVGGTIYRLNKVSDLPNAYGGRDIWGGKTNRGFAEVKLIGIDGAVLTLEVTDISINSTETVMDRYKPFADVDVSANVTNRYKPFADVDVSANVRNRYKPFADVDVSANVTHGGSSVPESRVTKLDTAKQPYLNIAGVRVTFTDVSEYNVQYTITDTMAGSN